MADQSWDDRFTEFLERVMAVAAANGDAQPLKAELERLLTEAPASTLKRLKLERPNGKSSRATKPAPTG